jgi:cyclomaltodextrin glucanotransferase
VSVLDFPLKERVSAVFGKEGGGFEKIAERLYLTDGPYTNPYELTTFYDNHDMARMNASDDGFIDAHHWLFTARGIPVIYYGSEIGFERGTAEHTGNRNYFGQTRVEQARTHPIHDALRRIAKVREATPALQRGLQVNLEFKGDRAAFYRVLQVGNVAQIALVLLNKGAGPAEFRIDRALQPGRWTPLLRGGAVDVAAGGALEASVPAHGVEVYVLNERVTAPGLRAELMEAEARKTRR